LRSCLIAVSIYGQLDLVTRHMQRARRSPDAIRSARYRARRNNGRAIFG
jgi:hypothetical protein